MLKRDLRLFLRCLIPAAVLAAVLAAVCAAAAFAVAQGAEKVYTPVKAAVVDGENSVLSRMLISAVAEQDYIKNLLEVETCEAEDAYRGLSDGTYAAVIELPEDFLGDIFSGREKQGRITLSSAAAASSETVRSIAAFGELLLASGQYAAFSSSAVIDRHVPDEVIADRLLDAVNRALMAEAMTAQNKYFSVTVAAYADTGISLTAHYLVTWLAALTMLCAVMFDRLFTADCSRSMLLRLRASGISGSAFLLWKLILVFLFLFSVLLLGSMGVQNWVSLSWSAEAILFIAAGALVCASTVGAVLMANRNGAPVWLAGTVIQVFLCGGLVPRQMLPRPILIVGDLLPLGIVRSLLSPLFGGSVSLLALGGAAVWGSLSITAMLLQLSRLRAKGGAE